jgi:hypothetical protein
MNPFDPYDKSDNTTRDMAEPLRVPTYESLVILQQAVAAGLVSWI